MSLDRELIQHREHAITISRFELEQLAKHRDSIHKTRASLVTECQKFDPVISKMRIHTNRPTIFKKLLPGLLDKEISNANLNIDPITTHQQSLILDAVGECTETFPNETVSQNLNRLLFKIRLKRAEMTESQKEIVMAILRKIASIADQLEDRLTLESLSQNEEQQDKFIKLREEQNNLIQQINDNDIILNDIDKQLKTAFKPESISTSVELKNLISKMSAKNIEILVLGPEKDLDFDLAAVIKMRMQKAAESGRECICLSFDNFNKIMQEGHDIPGVNKLSFLHHGDAEFGYANKISHYIEHLPDLTDVVLRGCGTAKEPAFTKQIYYEPKLSPAPYDKMPPLLGETSLAIQQKEENGKIITKISWATIDPNTNKRITHQIPNITSISKITKKPTDDQLSQLSQIQGMPLLKHSNQLIHSTRNTFFDTSKKLAPDEIHHAKKVFRRARTESVTHSNNDLLSQVWNNMTPKQQQRIAVKAYMGAYAVEQGRVVPSDEHDQAKLPKAVRINPTSRHNK